MGFLDEVISAALGAKASSLQSQSPQSAPVQDQFSQIAAALQELLLPKQGPVLGQAAAPTSAAQQSSSGSDVLLRRFQQNGFGEIINSWIGPGQNQPISPTQLRSGHGPEHGQRSRRANGCATGRTACSAVKVSSGYHRQVDTKRSLSSQVYLQSR